MRIGSNIFIFSSKNWFRSKSPSTVVLYWLGRRVNSTCRVSMNVSCVSCVSSPIQQSNQQAFIISNNINEVIRAVLCYYRYRREINDNNNFRIAIWLLSYCNPVSGLWLEQLLCLLLLDITTLLIIGYHSCVCY